MNPSQKAGNSKPRRRQRRYRRKDAKMQRIARQEARKVVAKKIESKVSDRSSIAFAVDASASTSIFNILSSLVRGFGETNYIGDSITPTHVRIRWACLVGDATNLLRVVLIQNKAGGVPIGSTLFQLSGSVNTPLSPYESGYSTTYRVLFDEFYGLDADTNYVTGDIRIVSSKLRQVKYDSSGNLTAGGIWLVFISDSTISSHPVGQFYSRVYFKDA